MALESLADVPLFRGIVFGLIGVGIWVVGLLFFNWMWRYFRGDDESEPGEG
jgi:hypothetical protein